MDDADKKLLKTAVEMKTKTINEKDVKNAVDNEEQVKKIISASGTLRKYLEDIKTLYSLINDYRSGRYTEVPWLTIAASVATLIYVLSPIDLIPDVIPVLGLTDDAFVIAMCLGAIANDLELYIEWKKKNPALA